MKDLTNTVQQHLVERVKQIIGDGPATSEDVKAAILQAHAELCDGDIKVAIDPSDPTRLTVDVSHPHWAERLAEILRAENWQEVEGGFWREPRG